MLINSKKIMTWLEKQFPLELAENWDNVGFLIGNPDKVIKRILIALEVTPEVVQEAINKSVDLIVTHHPIIFKPMTQLVENDPHQKMIRQLIFHDMHVYAAHTNADIAEGGLSDMFLEYMKLKAIEGLMPVQKTPLLHWVVYVPEEDKEKLFAAVHQVGAGAIGRYEQCGFSVEGSGQFMPLEESNPVKGRINVLEHVKESRLEFISPMQAMGVIEQAILNVHPYETPAYSVIELKNAGPTFSLGRIAELDAPMELKALADLIKKNLKISHMRIVGQPKTNVRRIGILTGAGADAMKIAKAKRCDVFITGDIKYHEAQNAIAMGLPLIDVGHYNSEVIFKTALKNRMVEAFEAMDYDVSVEMSSAEKDPFQWV